MPYWRVFLNLYFPLALSLFKTCSNVFYRKQNRSEDHSFNFQDEFTFSLLGVDHICTSCISCKGNCFFCILRDQYNSFYYHLSVILSFININNIKQQNMVKHLKNNLPPPNICYIHTIHTQDPPPQQIHACSQ